jgi:hypothetical protein
MLSNSCTYVLNTSFVDIVWITKMLNVTAHIMAFGTRKYENAYLYIFCNLYEIHA